MTYSTEEAAKELNVSIVTLRRWIKNNQISFHRLGKLFRFTKEDLQSQFKSNIVKNNTHNDDVLLHDDVIKQDAIKIPDNVLMELEDQMLGLSHGIVKLSLHICEGIMSQYTITRTQSILVDATLEK
jgi:excisionase family DNA binding protein